MHLVLFMIYRYYNLLFANCIVKSEKEIYKWYISFLSTKMLKTMLKVLIRREKSIEIYKNFTDLL